MSHFKPWRYLGIWILFSTLPVLAQTITITKTSDFNFGNVIAAPQWANGSVIIDYSGAISYPSSYPGSPPGAHSPARFSVSSAPTKNLNYTIHFSDYTWVNLTGPGGNQIGVSPFVTNHGGDWCSSKTDSSGADSVSIGATALIYSGWEPPGTYTGTFQWIATYWDNSGIQHDFLSPPTTISITLQRYIRSIGISTSSSSLNFGEIIPHVTLAGSVTLNPATGVRSSAGGASLGSNLGVALLSFTVSGQPNTAYTITLPAGFSITAGAFSMPVAFSSNPSGTGVLGPGTTTGSQTLTVGGTLTVGANQAAANYSGTFSVIVSYF